MLVDGLLIITLLVGGCGVALAGAKGLLTLIFHLMGGVRAPAVPIYWRPVVFVVALFWFWYLTPAWAAQLAESQTLARVVHLFVP
jgi:hypothetical protein